MPDTPPSVLERELDVILQTSVDNFLVADGAGTVLRANANCYAIYGTEPGALLGRSVFDLEREGVFSPSVTAMVLKTGNKAQVMQTTRTGRLVLATGIPVLDDGGRLVRVISSSYDLTEIELLRAEYKDLQARTVGVASPPLPDGAAAARGLDDLVYRSEAMREVVALILRIARTDVSVLFLGETGVGKTELARFLHLNSSRAGGRFVALNCSTVPEPLFEAQLFGYEAGAFTGADRQGKTGLIEMADKGTLFLDEIGELPLAVQAKLLTVLEDRRLRRVGATSERSIDFRILASSNRNLKDLVDQGAFRADLYYRLSVFPITVPPLRLRAADIEPLASFLLRRLNTQYGQSKRLTAEALRRLLNHPWPGNIRELKNVLERLWLSSPGEDLATPPVGGEASSVAAQPAAAMAAPAALDTLPLKDALARLERDVLLAVRQRCKTTYEMADRLGISQPSVVRKLKRHGIDS